MQLPKLKSVAAGAISGAVVALGSSLVLPSTSQIESTVSHEGLSLTAYKDSAGVPTICFGSTRGVRMGMQVTLAECERRFRADLELAGKSVKSMVKVPVTQDQYDALVDLVFNLGKSKVAKSTLMRKLNASDYCGAAAEFDKWVYAKNSKTGKAEKLAGLVQRRAMNKAAFKKELVCLD